MKLNQKKHSNIKNSVLLKQFPTQVNETESQINEINETKQEEENISFNLNTITPKNEAFIWRERQMRSETSGL
jgi:hypothetical protein